MRIQILILTIVISSLITACAKKNTGSTLIENTEEAISGDWTVTQIGTNKITLKSSDKQPQIAIDVESKTISGNSGCNRISGNIKDLTTTSLKFGPIAATKRMCAEPNQERLFLEALNKTTSYKVRNNELICLDVNGNSLLTFVPTTVKN